MDQPSYMDSEPEPDFMTEQDAGNDPFAGVAPQPEPETSWEPAAQETSFAPDIDQAPPVDVEPETEPAIADMAAPEPEPQMTESYTSSASQGGEALTDERIAGAAATALGKLMVKRSSSEEEANPNTLDGLMRELLRPMIKEWLDANLPAIVERKVEEEVQRIARMAR
ncbi:MAG: pole-organizing protein PopZ [Henriciella sp.]|nr:pole-organizing protein PopZ [Henriciella sp.]MBK75351.1 pole-organizing protein PopZ [Henriciella sp.]PHR79686.1 MAG: pole-organizing protein PopZ [Henriciella sp.]